MAPEELIVFQRGRKLKHTSSALIQCDYDLNHCQPGRQEAQWHRLTVRGVISLVSEKLLTHIITPSPLKKKILYLFPHSNNHADAQGEGGKTERYNKEKLEPGVGRDFPKCFHSLF